MIAAGPKPLGEKQIPARGVTTGPALSLIVSVYNKAERLRLVLAACERQSFDDFEVIVGDDGSGEEVADLIMSVQPSCRFPIVHLWHEDKGWRKNTMLNKAIRAARGSHLVFIDGDCLPSTHFLRDHWSSRRPGGVLLGRRAEMSRRWSDSMTVEKIRNGSYERLGWREFRESLRGEMSRFEEGIRIPSSFLRTILLRRARGMLGSNFSAGKEDLVAINGFDEVYTGPGCGEDTDIEYRLSLIGVTGISMRNLAIQFHLHHPRAGTSQASWDRFHTIVKHSREPRCASGLQQL